MITNHSTLEVALLTYFYQCITNGKTSELEEVGIDVEDMKLIRKLSVLDLPHIQAGKGSRLLKNIEIDRKALEAIHLKAAYSAEENKIIDELVEASAHYPLIHHYFGVTKTELSTRRTFLDISLRGRRKRGKELSRKDTVIVLDYVRQHVECMKEQSRHSPITQCRALLSTAELTGISVDSIWEAVDLAEQTGAFSWAA